MISGIYSIYCNINQKQYIGSSVNVNQRINKHFRLLENGIHPNYLLQYDWLDYTIGSFDWKILEQCDCNKLVELEQYYFTLYKPEYNLNPTAGSPLGFKHSDLTKAIMSFQRIGNLNNISNRKLSKEQVLEARYSLLSGRELARKFNCTEQIISDIRTGKTYKEIK